MKMLETIHILPVRAESEAVAPLRGKKLDRRAVLQVVRRVDWKKAGLIAGGATVVCAAAGTASRYKFYQGIVARELKKQLAPLNDKLDALQAENRMLRAELEKKNAPAEEKKAAEAKPAIEPINYEEDKAAAEAEKKAEEEDDPFADIFKIFNRER